MLYDYEYNGKEWQSKYSVGIRVSEFFSVGIRVRFWKTNLAGIF